MKLIEPTMEYAKEIQEYRQAFLKSGDSVDGCGSLRRFENSQDWIEQVESMNQQSSSQMRRLI